MNALLLAAGALLVWALLLRRLQRFAVSGPVLMAAFGAGLGLLATGDSATFLNSETLLVAAEITLALLLFVDAVDVRSPLRGTVSKVPLRLLLIALPLSLLLTMAVGLALPLGLSVAAVLAIACIAIPVDFSPESTLVRDRRIPGRVRRWLNIESGYNDGLVTPVLLAALALGATEGGDPRQGATYAFDAFLAAAPSGLIAAGVGAVTGSLGGFAFRRALRSGWADAQSLRIGLVALPLFTFAVAFGLGGSGFVAAFVCGLVFRLSRGAERREHPEAALVEDLSALLSLILWLAFGVAAVLLLTSAYAWWPAVLLALFALTVGRFGPVLLSLVGSKVNWRERLFMATMGPRGAAAIVFSLIAFNALPPDDGFSVLAATSMVIVGSLVLHSMLSPLLIGRFFPAKH